MKEEEILDKNIFMMCETLNRNALSELSASYSVRNCRPDELGIWKAMPFDDADLAKTMRVLCLTISSPLMVKKKNSFLPKLCLSVIGKINQSPLA